MEASSMSKIVGRSAMIGSILLGSRLPRILATSSLVANPCLAASVERLFCIIFLHCVRPHRAQRCGWDCVRCDEMPSKRCEAAPHVIAGKRSIDLVQHPL